MKGEKMKRILKYFLVLVLLLGILTLTGCGKKENEKTAHSIH